jgi:hypothetical protein
MGSINVFLRMFIVVYEFCNIINHLLFDGFYIKVLYKYQNMIQIPITIKER